MYTSRTIHNIIQSTLSVLLFCPLITNAQVNGIRGFATMLQGYINQIISLLIGVALLFFIYHLAVYMMKASEDSQKQARKYMVWGIVVIFVMTSIWGIVNIAAQLTATRPNLGLPPLQHGSVR